MVASRSWIIVLMQMDMILSVKKQSPVMVILSVLVLLDLTAILGVLVLLDLMVILCAHVLLDSKVILGVSVFQDIISFKFQVSALFSPATPNCMIDHTGILPNSRNEPQSGPESVEEESYK